MANRVRSAKQKAALRKAQLASARKRRRGGRRSPRQIRREIKREKYGSRRRGLTKAQYQQRQKRRQRRVAKGVAYGFSAAYVGAAAYAIAPNQTAKAIRKTGEGMIKASKADYRTAPKRAKMKYQTHRTNRKFKKIVAHY